MYLYIYFQYLLKIHISDSGDICPIEHLLSYEKMSPAISQKFLLILFLSNSVLRNSTKNMHWKIYTEASRTQSDYILWIIQFDIYLNNFLSYACFRT